MEARVRKRRPPLRSRRAAQLQPRRHRPRVGRPQRGERSTALLVTRLLLAGSATRAPTVWFDEPLEHLDPRRRAATAQTIVRAAQAGAVGQLLVTTYEEGLARRLAATAPDTVELTYARTNQG